MSVDYMNQPTIRRAFTDVAEQVRRLRVHPQDFPDIHTTKVHAIWIEFFAEYDNYLGQATGFDAEQEFE